MARTFIEHAIACELTIEQFIESRINAAQRAHQSAYQDRNLAHLVRMEGQLQALEIVQEFLKANQLAVKGE